MYQASPKAPGTPESRSEEFAPYTGNPTETSSAELLLVLAYVLMWSVLMAFLLQTFRRQAAVEKRLGALERSLPQRAPDA